MNRENASQDVVKVEHGLLSQSTRRRHLPSAFNQLRVQPATDQLVLKDLHHVISVLCEGNDAFSIPEEIPSQCNKASSSVRNIKVESELFSVLDLMIRTESVEPSMGLQYEQRCRSCVGKQ